MHRLRTIPLAIAVLAVSGGAALAFSTMPDASTPGLAKAAAASGHVEPRRTTNEHTRPAPDAPTGAKPTTAKATTDATTDTTDTTAAASHGAAVSAVARAADTTPDTNHGADVSAVAKANHGQTVAAAHRPADAGEPADPGKPDDAGKPTKP